METTDGQVALIVDPKQNNLLWVYVNPHTRARALSISLRQHALPNGNGYVNINIRKTLSTDAPGGWTRSPAHHAENKHPSDRFQPVLLYSVPVVKRFLSPSHVNARAHFRPCNSLAPPRLPRTWTEPPVIG